jgi:hypothetical protein
VQKKALNLSAAYPVNSICEFHRSCMRSWLLLRRQKAKGKSINTLAQEALETSVA